MKRAWLLEPPNPIEVQPIYVTAFAACRHVIFAPATDYSAILILLGLELELPFCVSQL